MKYYKNSENMVYAYDDDTDEKYILTGLIEITKDKALILASPPPTHEQLIADAIAKKNELRTGVDGEISWLQDAVDMGIATDKELALLAAWKEYRVLLMRIDTGKAPDIKWPPDFFAK